MTCLSTVHARRTRSGLPVALHHLLILAAVGGLLFASTPAGAQSVGPPLTSDQLSALELRTIGPANMSGRVVDLAVVESDPVTFYVATATGGLWKTTDGGVTYEAVFENEAVHSIGAVAVHPVETEVVWVGSGERANRQSSSWGDGVYRSTDGGETWANVGLRDSHHIGRITLHPEDPDIAWVAAMGHLWGPNAERGLYRTGDGGRTWQQVLFIDQDTGVVDVALDPLDPDIVYAATYQRRRTPFGFDGGGPGSGLFKSSDGGRNWKELVTGLPEGEKGRIGISLYRRDPSIVYVCVEQGWRYNASTAYTERRAGIYRSEDHGESWTWMSDWNPRPMYASQILVDPNDDQRIYMQNSFSRSEDGGKSFSSLRQSLHGDDRILWVDPADSRHLIKGDDGGVGISWDMGGSWLFVTDLPVSQFYRLSVDMAHPFRVYGGLQDNGSWYGPSATFRSEGVLNEDWIRTGGGDGFFNVIDPTDNRTLYTNSQYLGLSRLDLVTGQRQDIRPGDLRGAISARRNWDAWGPGRPEPELGNAMASANWDAPILLSPHDHQTLFAGTDHLWKSTDQGRSWVDLGELTTGVDRRELTIMGRRADDDTPSLDDGIPYYPTLTAIEESPLVAGLLYVGTDDGQVQVSEDGGRTWTNVSDRFPGLPGPRWVADLEASHFAPNTVYAAFDGHRSDDFANHLYRSTDRGRTWRPVTGDLPADRVVRAVHEDPRNPRVLWLGTEFGCFVTLDGGRGWTAVDLGMPTVAVNDLLVHPRDNDLVLATHGRGIWILDNVNALQELTPEIMAAPGHLFTIEPAEQIRYAGEKAHMGNMVFRGENPPRGAVIDYWLKEGGHTQAVMEVFDEAGRRVNEVRLLSRPGVNRAVWGMTYAPDFGLPEGTELPRGRMPAILIPPGTYTVRLTAAGVVHERLLVVRDDPRLEVDPAVRQAWTDDLFVLQDLYYRVTALSDRLTDHLEGLSEGDPRRAGVEALQERLGELRSRVTRMAGEIRNFIGPLTADQQAQRAYFEQMLGTLRAEADQLIGASQ